jgi:hypothetical protein
MFNTVHTPSTIMSTEDQALKALLLEATGIVAASHKKGWCYESDGTRWLLCRSAQNDEVLVSTSEASGRNALCCGEQEGSNATSRGDEPWFFCFKCQYCLTSLEENNPGFCRRNRSVTTSTESDGCHCSVRQRILDSTPPATMRSSSESNQALLDAGTGSEGLEKKKILQLSPK